MQRLSDRLRSGGKSIGLVPTMGFLHEGHLSLIKKSKQKADITIVTIFVNPTQFAPTEDLAKYPRDINRDKALLKQAGVDYVFIPSVKDIYPGGFKTFVEVDKITRQFEGEFRPTHFKGVTTVVAVLFNIVKPDYAFFGRKDAQQAAVIMQMVKDLKMGLKIITCPIIREPDGLAKSSRNIFLSPRERSDALILNKSLQSARRMVQTGNRNTVFILNDIKKNISAVTSAKLDYVKLVDEDTFEEADKLSAGKKYYILVACKFGSTRLIDNILIKA